ncbi:MAG: hypothetical protein ACK4N5_27805, partial [Myxococcales bacterium]
VLTVTPARPTSGTLTYVAETNPRIDGVSFLRDLVPGGDADAEFGVTVTGAQGGTVTFKLNNFDLVPPMTVSSNNENFGGPVDLIFSQDTDATLVVAARDPFGNTASHTYRILVDVQPPAAPAVTATLADNRAAKVNMQWTGTGDDGSSGNLAGYVVRYLTSSAAASGFSCPTVDEAAFNGTAITRVTTVPAGGAAEPASAESVAGGRHHIVIRDPAELTRRGVQAMIDLVKQACAQMGV